jgi:hypothetical protein
MNGTQEIRAGQIELNRGIEKFASDLALRHHHRFSHSSPSAASLKIVSPWPSPGQRKPGERFGPSIINYDQVVAIPIALGRVQSRHRGRECSSKD